ncbi:hypothetical protein [Desulfovibrio sp.]|uniref:hypothetical protein n=1 Tax=Desulfovibrio sp. TaxID=885 RepID=UPI0025BFF9BD|nr:hypothetical protein [Desulfovibrio sp.]
MVETRVHENIEKYKSVKSEEAATVCRKLDEFSDSIYDMLLRLQLIQSFSENESDKLVSDEIQIHSIALVLKDITHILKYEVDKFDLLSIEIKDLIKE